MVISRVVLGAKPWHYGAGLRSYGVGHRHVVPARAPSLGLSPGPACARPLRGTSLKYSGIASVTDLTGPRKSGSTTTERAPSATRALSSGLKRFAGSPPSSESGARSAWAMDEGVTSTPRRSEREFAIRRSINVDCGREEPLSTSTTRSGVSGRLEGGSAVKPLSTVDAESTAAVERTASVAAAAAPPAAPPPASSSWTEAEEDAVSPSSSSSSSIMSASSRSSPPNLRPKDARRNQRQSPAFPVQFEPEMRAFGFDFAAQIHVSVLRTLGHRTGLRIANA
eukprot:1547061-Rhodomonas_salina.1